MDNPLKKTCYDRVSEALSILSVAAAFFPLLFYKQLGDGNIIPIHYNSAGEIDGWGSRCVLWILPLLALLFYIGFSFLEKYYKKWNYPIKITTGNAASVYRASVCLMRRLKLFCLIAFAYLNNSSLAVASGHDIRWNRYFLAALLPALFGTVAVYLIKIRTYRE